MRRYDRDEYEDLDEYEEEDDDQEEEEAPEPSKEEVEYLELRQRLKESKRKQIKKESGSAISQEKKKKFPIDNYGSFFGPSQPVIAQRVIQESKSLLENQHLAAKVTKSHNGNNKNIASNTARPKPRVHDRPPKVVNELRSKVQKLKDTRDYSFLLSDDVDPPAPRNDPPSRNITVPQSEARSAQVPPKSKQSSSNTGRHVRNDCEERKPLITTGRHVRNDREERKPLITNSHMQKNEMGSHKLASVRKPNLTPVDSRKQLGSNYGNGPGRPPVPKSVPLKTPAANNEKKVFAVVAKSSVASTQKVPSSKLHSSVPKHQLERRKEFQESSKGKMMPKQPMSSSKAQVNEINKPPPKASSRAILQDDRPKKKPAKSYPRKDDDSDDGGKAISMIRRMFNYNPRKYTDREDDDSDMEANFDDILKEEKRSAKIARREDEEELRKIEEEERRERLRKEAKKRKLSQR